ncbi:MAG: MFS transporter [Deltaproteobacteria bacterium]|nr:MFS transporter [Deltaproteobacteria bacterium]
MASTVVTKSVGSPRIFYGWWMVMVSCIAMAAGPILITGTFGIFIKPLGETFGWSRSAISFAFSLVALLVSLYAPVVGTFVDRFGPRKVILCGAVVFGSGFCSFWFLSDSLWQFYGSYLLTALGGACLTSIPFATAISRWFVRQRGLALGLMGTGVFLGGMYAPPLVTYIITHADWRWAYVALGLLVWGIAIPTIGLFLTDSPQQIGLYPDGKKAEEPSPPIVTSQRTSSRDHTLAEARKTVPFWCMAASFALLSGTLHGCITHLAPLLTDTGLSPQQAATALMLLSAMGVLGRVIAGYLVDRFPAHLVAAGLFTGVALGLLAGLNAGDQRLALVFAAMIGLGFGAETDIMPYLIGHHFGLASFGKIFGWLYGAFAFGAVLGPLLMGWVFDTTGSYHNALMILIPATVLGAGLMLPLGGGGSSEELRVKSAELQA